MRSFLSIQYVHSDLCKHLGTGSSTDHPDRYSNLFLNAYINRQSTYLTLCMLDIFFMLLLSFFTPQLFYAPNAQHSHLKKAIVFIFDCHTQTTCLMIADFADLVPVKCI